MVFWPKAFEASSVLSRSFRVTVTLAFKKRFELKHPTQMLIEKGIERVLNILNDRILENL